MTVADKLSKRHKEVSIAEFFEKNRHLLGFDSRLKATLTIIKEAVDNSLDACEEMNQELPENMKNKILPIITVDLKKVEDVYEILDNGVSVGEVVRRGDKFEVSYQGRRGTFKSKYAGHNFKIGGYDVKIKVDDDNKISVYINGKKKEIKAGYPKFRVKVLDNGPGIVKDQIPKIFGTLLYGSKFTRLRQSRGQQGIGITSAVLYSQLTTGRPAVITSKVGKNKPAYRITLTIDTSKNKAQVLKTEVVDDFPYDHGTLIELEFEGEYRSRGDKSVEEYLKRTAIVNPHATIIFKDIDGKKIVWKNTSKKYPKPPKEIKPHPYGLELGMLMKMLASTSRKTLLDFLTKELSRISVNTAYIILSKADLKEDMKPQDLSRDQAERLLKAMQRTKLLRPPTDVLSPIGARELEKSLKQDTKAEFVVTVSRPPTTYRGMPFMVEVGIAYGGEITGLKLYRYANKIPLLYEQSSGAIFKAVTQVGWRRYKVPETSSGLPQENIILLAHVASVWVPYTSESKSAIAAYPEIVKELKLAFQEAARKLSLYLSARYKERIKKEKVNRFFAYGTEVAVALANMVGEKREKILEAIKKLLEYRYGSSALSAAEKVLEQGIAKEGEESEEE